MGPEPPTPRTWDQQGHALPFLTRFPSGLENCGFSHGSRSITPGLFTSALRFYASVTFSHFMWDYVLCVPKSS